MEQEGSEQRRMHRGQGKCSTGATQPHPSGCGAYSTTSASTATSCSSPPRETCAKKSAACYSTGTMDAASFS
eukprot:668890-Pelagomonas_calceolata.AAC.4